MNEYNSYDILVEWAKQKVIDKLKRKNRPQQKPARTYSEVSSGDVHSPISSCATDTLRTSKNATAKIQQKTQSAKNNIKKFQNNDFLIDFSSFQTVVRGLRKMLSLEYKGDLFFHKAIGLRDSSILRKGLFMPYSCFPLQPAKVVQKIETCKFSCRFLLF